MRAEKAGKVVEMFSGGEIAVKPGVSPEESFGIEDSFNGIRSCHSAGLNGKYDPGKMFSCMAEFIILMMGGR